MRTHFDPNNMNVLTLERQRSSQSTPVNGGQQLPQSRGSTASLHSAHSSQQASQQLHQQSQMTSVPLTPVVPTTGQFQAINNTYQGMDMGALQQYAQISAQPDAAYLIPGQHPHMAGMGAPNAQPPSSAVYYSGSQMAYNPHGPGMAAYPESHMAPQTAPHLAGALEEDRKRKAANANAANDRELREMLRVNEARQLPDVAREVIANERTAKAEKTKQLFAMLWLRSSCRSAKTSVPRGRVYATYVSRCGNERVQPLNPASFGKLVRVIFPGIQTRRLGVRGESKYHYVDLALVDDVQDSVEISKQRNASISLAMPPDIKDLPPPSGRAEQINSNSIPRLTADTAMLGDDSPAGSPTPHVPTSAQAEGRAFVDHITPGFHTPGVSTANSYEQALIFSMNTRESDSHIIELPDIWSYASPKMDIDAANTLVALYRSHCTSLIDSVRFCKEKQFFRLFTTLSGALTVPVQKLFLHPDIAAWIRECDWIMYQKMLQCVAPLTLQVVPPIVVKFLDTVSRNLHAHIRKTFSTLPKHTLEAKLEPATLFSSLLHRMNRVNQTAHAAANVLESADLRDQMWNDWVRLVNPKRIMETELPNCGYEEVYRILTKDVRAILQPSTTDVAAEAGTHYQGTAGPAPLYGGLETVVDRLHCFVETLPSRFPNATARRLMTCISNLGSAALRDITINGGTSFNCWWLTKVFLDEMSHWLAAYGGFMEHQPPVGALKSMQLSPSIGVNGAADATQSGAEDESRGHSRYSSRDISASAVPLPRPSTAPRQPSPLREPTVIETNDHNPPQPQNRLGRASPTQQLLAENGVNGASRPLRQSSRLHPIDSATHLAEEQLTMLEQHPDMIHQDHSELPAEVQLEIELQKQIRQMEARDASRHAANFEDSTGMSFSTSSFESLMSNQPMQQPQAQQIQMMDVTVHDDNIDDSGICMTFTEDRIDMKEATDNLLNSNRKRRRVASAAHGQEQRPSKR